MYDKISKYVFLHKSCDRKCNILKIIIKYIINKIGSKKIKEIDSDHNYKVLIKLGIKVEFVVD